MAGAEGFAAGEGHPKVESPERVNMAMAQPKSLLRATNVIAMGIREEEDV